MYVLYTLTSSDLPLFDIGLSTVSLTTMAVYNMITHCILKEYVTLESTRKVQLNVAGLMCWLKSTKHRSERALSTNEKCIDSKFAASYMKPLSLTTLPSKKNRWEYAVKHKRNKHAFVLCVSNILRVCVTTHVLGDRNGAHMFLQTRRKHNLHFLRLIILPKKYS